MLRGAADHGHVDEFACAFGIRGQLPRQIRTYLRECWEEAIVGHNPTRATGQHNDRVVGRHAPVGVHPIERGRHGLAQRSIQLLRTDDDVGRDHREHRRHPGSQHAGTLGHTPDPIAGLEGRGLGHRVGGHDGLCSPLSTLGVRRGDRVADTRQQPAHVQTFADESCGTDRDVDRPDPRASATASAV